MSGDPEIDAMGAVVAALDKLDEPTRSRVIDWTAKRFGVASAPASGAQRHTPGASGGVAAAAAPAAGDDTFDDFPTLLAKGKPKTDAQRALLAAYWHQVIGKKPSFQSQDLNKELKDTGNYINNIPSAMDGLIGTSPQQVVQLKKTGNQRQGRRTFKLTSRGVEVARGMLGGGAADGDEE
jgi:hypothetical protein